MFSVGRFGLIRSNTAFRVVLEMTDGRTDVDSVGCSRSHVHNGASHVHRVRVRVMLGLGLGFVDIRVRVRVRARVRVSVRVRFSGHYVDIVGANCGRL